MRIAAKENGKRYYEYMVAYVDDLLCCGEKPEMQMDVIRRRGFILKDGSVERPKICLGGDIEEYHLLDDPKKLQWTMSSTNYTVKAVTDVKTKLKEEGLKLLSKVSTPLSSGY